MPCRKGRLHIVTYRIIDEGLRAGAGIDRICHGVRCRNPFAAPHGAVEVPNPAHRGVHWSSGLEIEALRRFGESGFYGIGLKAPIFARIGGKSA